MPNGRCRMHGGPSLSGLAHPGLTHGRYSKVLPTALLETFRTALADPELLDLSSEIALVDARLEQVVADAGAADAEEREAVWRRVGPLIDRRQRLVESERKRRVEMQQMISADRALVLALALSEAVRRHVQDGATLAAIAADLRGVLSRSADRRVDGRE